MLNKPDKDYLLNLRDEELLAGEKFEANEQCRLVFGSSSTVCPYMVLYSELLRVIAFHLSLFPFAARM